VEVPPVDERHLDRGTAEPQHSLEPAEATPDYNHAVHDHRSGIGDDVRVPTRLMLATLTDRRDFGDDWLLERKFDGERCVAKQCG
jgi:ATP-dependent DNA ligase